MKTHSEHAKSGIIRQGDVMLVPIAKLPKNAVAMDPDDRGRVVLAEGEVTGHAHALPFGGAVMFREDGSGSGARYLSVSAPTALSHEEHSTHVVPLGPYRVIRQREYDDMEARRVAD